jgi:hypothetical protein
LSGQSHKGTKSTSGSTLWFCVLKQFGGTVPTMIANH